MGIEVEGSVDLDLPEPPLKQFDEDLLLEAFELFQ